MQKHKTLHTFDKADYAYVIYCWTLNKPMTSLSICDLELVLFVGSLVDYLEIANKYLFSCV